MKEGTNKPPAVRLYYGSLLELATEQNSILPVLKFHGSISVVGRSNTLEGAVHAAEEHLQKWGADNGLKAIIIPAPPVVVSKENPGKDDYNPFSAVLCARGYTLA